MHQEGSETVLGSGRRFYSFCGRLHPEPHGRLTYGHDSRVHEVESVDVNGEAIDDSAPLTAAERGEIAQAMIERWAAWAQGSGLPGASAYAEPQLVVALPTDDMAAQADRTGDLRMNMDEALTVLSGIIEAMRARRGR